MGAWVRSGAAPAASTIAARFGGWRRALEAAGVRRSRPVPCRSEIRHARRRAPSVDELDRIRAFVAEHGKAPTVQEWRDARLSPSTKVIIRRHGTWNRALQAAGVAPRRRARWERSQVIAALRTFHATHGRPPMRDEWIRGDATHPSARTVANHFGTWTAAVAAALGGSAAGA